MQNRASRRRGNFAIEVIAGLGITAFLVTVSVMTTNQYAAARRDGDARRLLALLADAELNRIETGTPAGAITRPGWVSELEVAAEQVPGTGEWAGLTHVTVTARGRVSHQRVIEVRLGRYMLAAEVWP